MTETIRFHIRTVAPIHIGCDEVYEPTNFIVDEQKGILKTFDPLAFVRALNPEDKAEFSAICGKGTIESLLEIYKFMRGKSMPGRNVNLCSGFVKHYQETMKLPVGNQRKIQQELNNFAIARTAFNPNTGLPYIPGSSIKGALRTAWLNEQNQDPKRQIRKNDRRKGKDLEKELLDGGSFATDPLRMLKVSDFMPVGRVKTRIAYCVNKKKSLTSKFEAHGPYQILEIIEPGSVFEGTVSIDTPLTSDIRNPLNKRALINAAIKFYVRDELQRENKELDHIGILGTHPEIPEGGFVMRIGRHSSAESVTIAGHRSVRIMQGRGKPDITLDHATTFWLATEEQKPTNNSNLRPFGWATVTPGPATVVEEIMEEDEQDVPAPSKPPVPEKTAVEKILDELVVIKPDDMGRLGTIIQKIETLPEDKDKAAIALAIKKKLGKAYKKHKKKPYLASLLANCSDIEEAKDE